MVLSWHANRCVHSACLHSHHQVRLSKLMRGLKGRAVPTCKRDSCRISELWFCYGRDDDGFPDRLIDCPAGAVVVTRTVYPCCQVACTQRACVPCMCAPQAQSHCAMLLTLDAATCMPLWTDCRAQARSRPTRARARAASTWRSRSTTPHARQRRWGLHSDVTCRCRVAGCWRPMMGCVHMRAGGD